MARPLPRFPEPDTQPYWDATREHRLTYQVCQACQALIFHSRRSCTKCGSMELERRTSAGNGTVYSYSLVPSNRMPGFAELGPYAVALIDLDEGFRMLSNVIGTGEAGVQVGQRVRVAWEDQEGGLSLPLFEPA